MTLEQIITVSVLCVWFTFPMGILISFMIQSNHQKYPKVSVAPDKKPHHHKHPHLKNFVINDVDEDGEYVNTQIPSIPVYQIPKGRNETSHWKT